MALSKAIALSTYQCQPSHLPVLVDWTGDPLGVRISSGRFMEWIHEDNLKESVCRIFTNPARVQDSQSHMVAPSSLLHNRLKVSSKLQPFNTMIIRLAIAGTLRNWAFAASTAHRNLTCDITLLGLVSQSACFIRPGGVEGPVECRELAVLPKAHLEKKAHSIGLLLTPQLLDVLVSAYFGLPLR